jgi:hypothetical protein
MFSLAKVENIILFINTNIEDRKFVYISNPYDTISASF